MSAAETHSFEQVWNALQQACANLAVLQPDLSRDDTTMGFQADLWRDSLLSGWGGPLGFDRGRRAAREEGAEPDLGDAIVEHLWGEEGADTR